MSLRADAAQCGGVVVEYESDDIREARERKKRSIPGSALFYLKGPKFLIYVSGALSMWGDRMWHFAISVFLIELYGRNLLLTAIFGLVVAGSVLLLGALIGDWVDRNPRNKAGRRWSLSLSTCGWQLWVVMSPIDFYYKVRVLAHASLFIQNISVTVCSIVLMLVFSYKKWIEQIWDGWLTVVCYTVVIVLADVANLASTALTIAIQRDWIVVITGYNRGHLAGMNATMRRIDQVTNILAPLAVGQVMTLASNVVGCGFILGWNLVSLIVEFIFLSRVYRIVPALSVKPPPTEEENFLEKKRERKSSQGRVCTLTCSSLASISCICRGQIKDGSYLCKSSLRPAVFLTEDTSSARLRERTSMLPPCLRRLRGLLSTCKEGWRAYYRQPVFLAGLGLAFLYTTVLGFDCITTGYAYTQGISGSLLSLLMGVSAVAGLLGTVLFTKLRKAYGLVNTGMISSCLHLACLLLCVCSVFAPGSPMDLGVLMQGNGTDVGGMTGGGHQRHGYTLQVGSNQPLLPDRSSIHWTNNTVLFENVPAGSTPDSYMSITLLFLGVITARVGE
ncbi:hypothetical protein NFI96_021644 [Prochilodus magdalenae]|nr:hypothetical protein NFI96_021644 [Prochilodus magdalenae]